ERTQKTPAPRSLKPGYYVILSSHTANFGDTDNWVSASLVWVSDLALITRSNTGSEGDGGFVLNANTGAPVSGARIRTWTSDRDGHLLPSKSTRTDERGAFALPGAGRRVLLLAEHNGHAVASDQLLNLGQVIRYEESRTSSVLFTDRALYRPGQSVHYKGISLQRDGSAGGYAVRAGVRQTVIFQDPNGQEITRATHVSNDYGSFSGVFVAPRDRLLGSMSLRLENGEGGVQVRVEEYKRPKFQVELAAPTEAAALDKAVALSGKATAYTGAAIGGAKVSWRVERQSQVPLWCWWWRPTPSQAIARGKSVTAPDGTFPVTFTAAPDRAVPQKNEPVFVFTVHADVTDTTGETRSVSRTVNVGYAALQATLSAGEWQTPAKPVALTVATKSLEGEPLPAKGTVTVDALIQPSQVERTDLSRERSWWGRAMGEPPVDPSNPDSWKAGRRVLSLPFTTGADGATTLAASLPVGIYRASLVTRDGFGREVTARSTLEVIDPAKRTYDIKVPNRVAAPTWSVEPGQTFTALWGTGYDQGRAFVELESDGKTLQRYWTAPDVTQSRIELPVTESMRGGFTLSITYVRQNRSYVTQRVVEVPWSNKELSLTWERFRSKLEPGQPETWTAVVAGDGAKQRAAEMVATLYDASLDQFYAHSWPTAFSLFRREAPARWIAFHNQLRDFQYLRGEWNAPTESVNWSYRALPSVLVTGVGITGEMVTLSAFQVSSSPVRGGRGAMAKMAQAAAPAAPAAADFAGNAVTGQAPQQGTPPPVAPDLSQVTARKNLQETAFFFPHLLAGDDGRVRLQFTMPEALTQWKFLGFAHDRALRSGFLTDKAVTAKDLMVEPNPPRFVREGDAIEFTVKVSNQADTPQDGKVRLTFSDTATLASVDEALGNGANEQAFTVPAKQSRTYSWRITVPEGQGFLTYKAVGATGKTSDGEEGMIPVLSRRILVSESLPLPIRGPSTREFEFKKLIESATSDTLRSPSLTVQMVSQPAWYAVMALPYLMEYPYECSEQVFNRLYANALARHVAQSDPKIRRIFDQWKGTPALDSPLEKNEALTSILLEETPWLRQAKSESQARRQVGLLFDGNRLDEETSRLVRSLSERQLGGGLWPWFPGGPPSEYISLYIVAGFGRLRHLGVKMDLSAGVNAVPALDAWMEERYRRIDDRDAYVPSSLDALYLYGRSFYLADRPVAPGQAEAVQYFLRQARRHWTKMESRQSHAHLALALKRWGDATTPVAILASLKERSVESAELGRFWNDRQPGWWWYQAPIETQAMMIEAFAEVTRDTQMVEDCKVWLLKQKQTQGWKTTKATADAVYALLLRGDSLLSSDARVEVSLAGETIQPEKVEAGTGFYEKTFVRDEVRPAMGQITVRKVDAGVSWGSVHWTYLEDVAKVTPHTDTPLRLKKTLFVAETTAKGRVLKPVTGAVAVGDELVVRLELRTDRDLEYVHLKDQRGSGTEPVEVLSRYRHQDGLSYYASTRDTASHFFIDYLPKGTYVFEYSTRVQLKGRYQSGLAEIQCMYAPEFNSHSESLTLQVD
ncbi:MAG: alpha-2-macroglobulin family protein, partial [Opitutaceae bacterium]